MGNLYNSSAVQVVQADKVVPYINQTILGESVIKKIMGKVKKCMGKESFARINYLYQIGNLKLNDNYASNNVYMDLIFKVSRKTVQRLDPQIKRTICKGCRSLLIPGETCKVRIKKKVIIWTCLTCTLRKRFETIEDYKLWIDRHESTVELYDYSQNVENFEDKL